MNMQQLLEEVIEDIKEMQSQGMVLTAGEDQALVDFIVARDAYWAVIK